MGSGNALGVSVAFPSFMFPLRFRYVSVTVSITFPSRFRCVSVRVSAALPLGKRLPGGNDPKTRPTWRCCWARAAEQIRNQNCFGTVAPTSSRNLRSRVRSWGSMFSGASSNTLPAAPGLGVRCDAGPRVALTRMCFSVFAVASENPMSHWGHVGSSVFRHVSVNVSVNVSVLFPSTFPLRFPQRFRWAGVRPMETTGNSPSVSGAH